MKFNVLVMDCPWQYTNQRTGNTLTSGASQQYQTLSMNELMDLKPYIDQVTKQDAIIYLWVTNPFLKEGLSLLDHYGFEYKTMLTWVKSNSVGLGYWYRGNTEHILFGTKGNVKPFRCQEINVFHAPIKGHSVKPVKSYEMIDEATKNIPDRRILELFARRYKQGWTTIGYDLDGIDIKQSLKRLIKT
jgi:N6-adenosine-specific RNA methylase IME4